MGHERRFEPPIVDILQKASGGHLGRILQIEANFSHDKFMTLNKSNWRLDPQEAPVAGMTATGIHLTDLSVKLLGAAKGMWDAVPLYAVWIIGPCFQRSMRQHCSSRDC